jgi:5S rRNA maturation endonuclease (ribonuclease M5)
VAVYDYVDEEGRLLYQVVRLEPKDFRQRRPDGRGGWIWNLDGTRRVLYRLPEVLAAVREGREVWIVEGEKDVEALRAAGVTATCNPGGAGKWSPEFSEVLRGARVVVVQDKDEPGYRHAQQVVASLLPVAASVRLVEARVGKDVADHLAAGYGLGDFVEVPVQPSGVALVDVLQAILNLLHDAVVLPSEEAYLSAALWAVHTWVFEAFRVSPYLFLNSPTPRCGKTRCPAVADCGSHGGGLVQKGGTR